MRLSIEYTVLGKDLAEVKDKATTEWRRIMGNENENIQLAEPPTPPDSRNNTASLTMKIVILEEDLINQRYYLHP